LLEGLGAVLPFLRNVQIVSAEMALDREPGVRAAVVATGQPAQPQVGHGGRYAPSERDLSGRTSTPAQDGAEVVNAVSDRARAERLRRILGDFAIPEPSHLGLTGGRQLQMQSPPA